MYFGSFSQKQSGLGCWKQTLLWIYARTLGRNRDFWKWWCRHPGLLPDGALSHYVASLAGLSPYIEGLGVILFVFKQTQKDIDTTVMEKQQRRLVAACFVRRAGRCNKKKALLGKAEDTQKKKIKSMRGNKTDKNKLGQIDKTKEKYKTNWPTSC